MDAQEFLKRVLLIHGHSKSALNIIKNYQEIEGGLLLTMQDGKQWRLEAVEIGERDDFLH